ncbi:MAG: Phosphoribosylglycinamide formyltransferase [Ignavibacteriaceae bacterium]|nr:Phosphoribosylglycinamide formyltransferase [Ignavibacteriaceae bacterium]
MRIVLLTSNHRRHKYIANILNQSSGLIGIISEEKTSFEKDYSQLSSDDQIFMQRHLIAREEAEQKYFTENEEFPAVDANVLIKKGQINSPEIVSLIREMEPTFLVLFGTSIIKTQLLELFPQRIINIHLGLSPYYRGSGTNLWPLYYNEPECVGSTIHLAINEVDAGGILTQLRPELDYSDSVHDIGNKVILKVGEKLPHILKQFLSGSLSPTNQHITGGKLFRRRDLNSEILKVIYQNILNGAVPDYLSNKVLRDMKKPIIEVAE